MKEYNAIVFFTAEHQYNTGDVCKTIKTNNLTELLHFYLEMKPIANKFAVKLITWFK